MDATTANTEQSKIQTAKEETVAQVRSVAETAGEQTKNVVSEVAEEVKAQIGDQKTKLASSIREIGDELDQAAQNGTGTVAGVAGQAAETTRQISRWIETHDARDVLAEIEDFARQRPVMFLAGAAALGFLVGRVTRNAVAVAKDNSNGTGQTIDLRQESALVEPAGPSMQPVVGATVPATGVAFGEGTGALPSDPHLTGQPSDEALLGGASGPLPRGTQGGDIGVGEVLPEPGTSLGQGPREGGSV